MYDFPVPAKLYDGVILAYFLQKFKAGILRWFSFLISHCFY
nr:MAG TPA: hypothetical protein [Caudoviricetes sp.]DAY41087.1 MAG TPA: hypothetical protein [Caudoviricetes sp.]